MQGERLVRVLGVAAGVEHPCVCRENPTRLAPELCAYGTSLRVQGEQYKAEIKRLQERNIPACAGRTAVPINFERVCEEHPCVCRENSARAYPVAHEAGTSLRVQGERPCRAQFRRRLRNIPACAGRTA